MKWPLIALSVAMLGITAPALAETKRPGAYLMSLIPPNPSEIRQYGHPWLNDGMNEFVTLTHSASAEQRKFYRERGMPCHLSTSSNAKRVVEIWYYGCIDATTNGGPGLIGKERVTFVNGRLTERTDL